MILLIDNYDSFSYNLYQLAGSMDPDIKTVRNDKAEPADIRRMRPTHIIISPGPGKPVNAGNCIEIIRELAGDVPILGVCLGHQCIVEAFGGKVTHAKKLVHGKPDIIKIDSKSAIFKGLPNRIKGARYHSLSADEGTIPECLRVTGHSSDNEVMAVEHSRFPVFGVQFHPESIMTPDGVRILRNFLDL